MTATGHALIGASIASQIPNPFISIPLAFLSHFLCDKVPHWDTMTDKNIKSQNQIIKETILDVALGFALVAVIFVVIFQTNNPPMVFLGAFVAQLPDWLEAPYSILKIKAPFFYENYRVQSWVHHIGFNSKLSAPWGIVTQIAVVLIFLIWASPNS